MFNPLETRVYTGAHSRHLFTPARAYPRHPPSPGHNPFMEFWIRAVIATLLAGLAGLAGLNVVDADEATPRTVLTAAGMNAPGTWLWPTTSQQVLRPFLAPATPYSSGHRGIDIAADAGELVRAPTSGTVTVAGMIVDRPIVVIETGHIRVTLEPVDPQVEVGDDVGRGEVVGGVASPGAHSQQGLHLGVRLNGEYVTPLLYLRPTYAVLHPVDG